ERDEGGPERLIDVATRIENILQKTLETAYSDPVELGTYRATVALDRVAYHAVLFKNGPPGRGIGSRFQKTFPALADQLRDPIFHRREPCSRFGDPIAKRIDRFEPLIHFGFLE